MVIQTRTTLYITASVVGILSLFSSQVQASGDRRTVIQPQESQPVCAILYPESGENSIMTQRRIQQALDHCPAGQAVRLSHHSGDEPFVSAPLRIPSDVFLRLDPESVLAADTDPRVYDVTPQRCGTIDHKGNGCRPFISIRNSTGGGIQGQGTIDGQGGQQISGQKETWWEMARAAQSITGGKQNAPRLIQIEHAQNITLYGIHLRNAPNFHIFLNQVTGATLWGIIIDTPASARNTDGIDPASSQDITITHSVIRTGDDNIAIKAGNGPAKYISITDNHFFSGHGMSIGSEISSGVSDVEIRNLTLDGTTSGIRIKSDSSRGGLVENIYYTNICMRNNRWPISFDTHYSSTASGDAIPEYRNIVLSNIHSNSIVPATVVMRGYNVTHPLVISMQGVTLPLNTQWQLAFTRLTTDKNSLQSNTSHVMIQPLTIHPQTDCSREWIPFPSH